ncbi:LemA family protein [Kiritimatiella glycovorans]|uniref:LemA family protein n=1 Tax=Kiritimatiella glycovorans TaxID=1307763 RepID=A0A0G3EDP7_9BACT|nr:LemA family protein [Kiritimatiella glycovorans]AKJ64458.1 LemA family protein [Kiritimatiella glycovorans]
MIPTLIVLAVIILLAIFAAGIYNKLVQLRNRFRNAFAQIDVQLKRRYDLIPNLVETAKGYMEHERETLEAVTQARNQAAAANQQAAAHPGDPNAMQNLTGAENTLGGALGRLLMTVESYPDLKANQNMSQLMEELTTTENKVAFARQAYNDAVMTYNTARETFPNVLVSGPLGFGKAELFEIENEQEREAPEVKF